MVAGTVVEDERAHVVEDLGLQDLGVVGVALCVDEAGGVVGVDLREEEVCDEVVDGGHESCVLLEVGC